MRSYTVKTHADKEFSSDYNYVSVIDTHYDGDGAILVLDVEVDESNEWRYQRELEMDLAVISYVCNNVFENEE